MIEIWSQLWKCKTDIWNLYLIVKLLFLFIFVSFLCHDDIKFCWNFKYKFLICSSIVTYKCYIHKFSNRQGEHLSNLNIYHSRTHDFTSRKYFIPKFYCKIDVLISQLPRKVSFIQTSEVYLSFGLKFISRRLRGYYKLLEITRNYAM